MSACYKYAKALSIAMAALALGACTGGMDDLENYVAEVKQRPGGRIEPLPEIKTYESFDYSAAGFRSPFTPDAQILGADTGGDESMVRPDANRNREFLEQFPLDTLRMVGSLALSDRLYALIEASDGLIHRVHEGDYMGQNHGKVISVDDSQIQIVEIVPDGLGGWMERPAAIALSE